MKAFQVAILGEGDRPGTEAEAYLRERFGALQAAFTDLGVKTEVVAFRDDLAPSLTDRLSAAQAVLVFVNPLHGGRDRTVLDGLLAELWDRGVFVSARPSTIFKLGTKDVLVDTAGIGWSRGDIRRVETRAALAEVLEAHLAAGSIRVLKQWRGNGGSGVWRIMPSPDRRGAFRAIEATRDSREEDLSAAELLDRLTPYVDHGGHLVDQPYYPPVPDGMLRCYLTRDKVVGFGHQYITALMPAPLGEAPPPARPRLYHPPTESAFQELRRRMEGDFLPRLTERLQLDIHALPVIWDADFLWERAGAQPFELCEINVSSVYPFPDSALRPMAEATVQEMQRLA